MKYNMEQEKKYRIKLKDLCSRYSSLSSTNGITFGIIFNFLKKRKIIEDENINRL